MKNTRQDQKQINTTEKYISEYKDKQRLSKMKYKEKKIRKKNEQSISEL